MLLLTGATGFIGGHLLGHLADGPTPLRALVRPGSARQFLERRGVAIAEGDVTSPRTLTAACEGVTTVVHLVGMMHEPAGQTWEFVVAEGTRSMVKAAAAAGVERFLYVSAIGARLDAPSRYHQTQALAEGFIKAAPMEYVIVRPSLVYGPGDTLLPMYLSYPVPIVGDGQIMVQPLHVDDLARILAAAAVRRDIVNQTFEVGGPDAMSFNDFVATIGRVTGRRMPHPHLPLALAEAQAWVFDRLRKPLGKLGIQPPLSKELILMLSEDIATEINRVESTFGIELTDFETGLRQWLAPRAA